MKKLTLLLLIVISCKEQDESCFSCKTEVFVNGERIDNRDKSNLYCYMDYETADYLEKVNNLTYYDEEGNTVETVVTCDKLIPQ